MWKGLRVHYALLCEDANIFAQIEQFIESLFPSDIPEALAQETAGEPAPEPTPAVARLMEKTAREKQAAEEAKWDTSMLLMLIVPLREEFL